MLSTRDPTLSKSKTSVQEEYRRELEAENLAKSREIKVLHEEMERLSKSRLSGPTSVVVSTCSKCEQKDAEIKRLEANITLNKQSLERQIKTLKQNLSQGKQSYDKQITTLNQTITLNKQKYEKEISTLKDSLSQAKISHEKELTTLRQTLLQNQQNYQKDLKSIKQSSTQRQATTIYQANSQQMQNLKKSYEELQKKFDELVRNEKKPVNIEERGGNELSITNSVLREQNRTLVQKIQFLEKRTYILEDTNRVLRQEILDYIHKRGTSYSKIYELGTSHIAKVSELPRNHDLPSVVIHPAQSLPIPPPHSAFAHKRNYGYVSRECNCNYVSPMSVLTKQVAQQNLTGSKTDPYYEKDLLAERYESLQRKIHLLQNENVKLRGEICPTHG